MKTPTKRIHMRDQVGKNKIRDIMTYYRNPYQNVWTVNLIILGLLLLSLKWP